MPIRARKRVAGFKILSRGAWNFSACRLDVAVPFFMLPLLFLCLNFCNERKTPREKPSDDHVMLRRKSFIVKNNSRDEKISGFVPRFTESRIKPCQAGLFEREPFSQVDFPGFFVRDQHGGGSGNQDLALEHDIGPVHDGEGFPDIVIRDQDPDLLFL
jgi:hypothetical protein